MPCRRVSGTVHLPLRFPPLLSPPWRGFWPGSGRCAGLGAGHRRGSASACARPLRPVAYLRARARLHLRKANRQFIAITRLYRHRYRHCHRHQSQQQHRHCHTSRSRATDTAIATAIDTATASPIPPSPPLSPLATRHKGSTAIAPSLSPSLSPPPPPSPQ